MGLEEKALEAGQLKGDLLKIKYVPLSILAQLDQKVEKNAKKSKDSLYFEENAKKHDIGSLAKSIIDHGFVDPPKWDNKLNKGKGGLVFGNGRTKTVILTLQSLKAESKQPPRGIGVTEDGDWAIPIAFGVDADSEMAAKRLAIDHNNLTMAGGDYTALDMARMWETEGYLELLKEQSQDTLPITVDGDDLELMLKVLNESHVTTASFFEEVDTSASNHQRGTQNDYGDDEDDYEEEEETSSGMIPQSSVRMAQLFLNTLTYPEYMGMIETLNKKYDTDNPTDCVLACLREAIQNYNSNN